MSALLPAVPGQCVEQMNWGYDAQPHSKTRMSCISSTKGTRGSEMLNECINWKLPRHPELIPFGLDTQNTHVTWATLRTHHLCPFVAKETEAGRHMHLSKHSKSALLSYSLCEIMPRLSSWLVAVISQYIDGSKHHIVHGEYITSFPVLPFKCWTIWN